MPRSAIGRQTDWAGSLVLRSLPDLIIFTFLTLMVVAAATRVPAVWSHRDRHMDSGAWRRTPWSRGWVRALPAGFGGGVCLVAGAWGIVLGAPVPFGLTMFGLMCLGAVLALLVITLNRPKFLVAPHLRGEPGAFSEILRSLRTKS